MSLKYRSGDIFLTKITHIAHGCNTKGVMGSGIARAIRARYPEAYREYRNLYESETHLKLGSIQFVPSKGKVIVNMITQRLSPCGVNYDRMVSYDALYDYFYTLNRSLPEQTCVAIPRIGAGLGGGDWATIEAIIHDTTPNLNITCFVPEPTLDQPTASEDSTHAHEA